MILNILTLGFMTSRLRILSFWDEDVFEALQWLGLRISRTSCDKRGTFRERNVVFFWGGVGFRRAGLRQVSCVTRRLQGLIF